MSDPSVHREIQARLDAIERAEGVRIVLAVESGSRAWGFPSRDSDWDVRFLYVRPLEWYLAIDACARPDVIERPVDGVWDFSGWDLRKALLLLRRSNPALLEWLRSPIVYREHPSIARDLRAVAVPFASAQACFRHYLHMAQGNFRGYLQGAEVRRKKYLYVLRPVLAMLWIERGLGQVPVEFDALFDTIVPPGALRDAIMRLLADKREGVEMEAGPRIVVLNEFLESELDRLSSLALDPPGPAPDPAPLNGLFRDALDVGSG